MNDYIARSHLVRIYRLYSSPFGQHVVSYTTFLELKLATLGDLRPIVDGFEREL